MRGHLLASAAWLLLLACNGDDDGNVGYNTCEQTSDCPPSTECAVDLAICESPAPAPPYQLILQVSNVGGATAGLTRYTFPPQTLTASDPAHDLSVPAGVRTLGTILRRVGENLVPVVAEVSFAPLASQTGFAVAPVVMTSRSELGDEGNNLRGTLAPDRDYDVTIYPLGEDSEQLPPVKARFSSAGNPTFSYVYEELDSLTGSLVDELQTPQGARWLRIHAGPPRTPLPEDPYAADDVVSSLAVVEADGSFVLNVLPGVLGAREYVLEVSLFDDLPWSTTIEVDASRLEAHAGAPVVIPTVPSAVRVLGSVEARLLTAAADANLSFVSEFPVPTIMGEVNDRDWCRSHAPGDQAPPFRCRSLVSTSTDREGNFEAQLLPGDYRVYISPSRATENSKRTLTTALTTKVETQPGGTAQGGQIYELQDALYVTGTVFGLSGRLENAIMRMLPLSGPRNGDTSPYNRISEGISNDQGEFDLPVDRGYFDLVVRPPEDSGYGWLCKANRVVSEPLIIGAFVMPPPVIVAGTVSVAGVSIPGATVDAYALVRDLANPGRERGIRIGSTTADEQGHYVLKLPTSIADEND